MKSLIAAGLLALACAGLSAQAPDRSKPPALGPAPALKLPQMQKRQLSNGLPVWVVEMHGVPVVQMNLVVPNGSASDPAGKYGVAALAAAMLSQGAGSRSALDLADAIDFLGAEVGAGAGIDNSTVRLHSTVAKLPDALPLMADVALRPTFPKEELDRLRQQRLTSLIQAHDDAATIASLAFSRIIYGNAHRFGTATMGTAETIKGFTVDDLKAFYSSAFRPDNATLIVVGDIAADKAVSLAETAYGGWKAAGSKPAHSALPAVAARTRREIYLVDKPGAPQSQIRIGALGVPRSTPDYFAIQVMNTILGGSFSSRLNMNLREEHGYTYGASSIFDMRLDPGPFYAAAGVQTDKTSESLKEFFKELTGILQTVPADELTRAKNYVALRFPGGFETTGDVSRRLEDALTYHLPDDYFARYVQNIQAVTAADVQRVAQKYVQPDKIAVVIVGDRKVIEPGIRALNLGPITVVPIDDVFGK